MGRSTKKCGSRIGLLGDCLLEGVDLTSFRGDLCAGSHKRICQSADDDLLAPVQTGFNDPQPECKTPKLDGLGHDLAISAHCVHDFAPLVRNEGAIRDEQRVQDAAVELDPPEGSGREK